MDKASAYGAGDCRFESCRGHFNSFLKCCAHPTRSFARPSFHYHWQNKHPRICSLSQKPPVGIEPTTIRLRSACSAN